MDAKRIHHRNIRQKPKENVGYTLLIALLAGGLLGCICAHFMATDDSLAISLYIQKFASSISEGDVAMPKLLASSWSILRWPLIVCLLGFSSYNMILIPVVFIFRGFFLAFCITSFVEILGSAGLLVSVILFGVESLICIPILFIIAMQIMDRTIKRKEGKGKSISWTLIPALAFRNMICLAIFFACILWETLFVPIILSGVGKLFL